jgi:hypothetical protein
VSAYPYTLPFPVDDFALPTDARGYAVARPPYEVALIYTAHPFRQPAPGFDATLCRLGSWYGWLKRA